MYWLIPSGAERELFRDVIRILAQQFEAPKFEAHLTLCQADRNLPAKRLRQFRWGPIRLRIRGVAHSSKFKKTLYVRCTPDRSLKMLVADLGGNPSVLSDPHVSLLYKRLPTSIRRELAATIKLPFRHITFDAIKAVSCTAPTETSKDVETWQVVATKKLSG